MSILEQLYHGDIGSLEPLVSPPIDIQKINEQIIEVSRKFKEKLDKSLQAEFDSLLEEQITLFPLEMQQCFVDGVRVGVNLMVECLYKPQKE